MIPGNGGGADPRIRLLAAIQAARGQMPEGANVDPTQRMAALTARLSGGAAQAGQNPLGMLRQLMQPQAPALDVRSAALNEKYNLGQATR